MIITLTGASFKSVADGGKGNIGTLSTWTISRTIGNGATYAGPTYVDKDAALSATVTLDEGISVGADGVTVTMGGEVVEAASQSGQVITISIEKVTGNVVIKVPTVNTSTGEETIYYTVTYNYVDVDGATIQNATTESVAAGTTMTFTAPAIDGYTVSSVSPESATINSDTTVTYTYTANEAEGDGEAYWVGEKLSGKTHGSGTASSYLGTQYYYITDEAAISELGGKTVDKMAFNFASKSGADTPTGTITVYLVNPSDSVPSKWETKAEIAVESYPAGSQKEFDITPFTVPTGYTIGYRASKSNILGGGYMLQDYKMGGAYYSSLESTSSTVAQLGGVDVHIQGA